MLTDLICERTNRIISYYLCNIVTVQMGHESRYPYDTGQPIPSGSISQWRSSVLFSVLIGPLPWPIDPLSSVSLHLSIPLFAPHKFSTMAIEASPEGPALTSHHHQTISFATAVSAPASPDRVSSISRLL
jgi:hypothetical protein